jgi:hypothetical protein
MSRTEALAAAIEIVEAFAPRANARGFADGAIKPTERVRLVLRVADWLLGDALAPAELGLDE